MNDSTDHSLEQEVQLLSGIIDSAMDVIITADEGQRIIIFNQAAEQVFGYSAAEVIGQSLEMLMPERFRKGHGHHIREFGKAGISMRAMAGIRVLYGLRANGEEFPFEASISQAQESGKTSFTVILRDISRRKENELKIHQLTQAYSALSQVNHLLIRCKNEQELFRETCRIAVEYGGMAMAWIGVINQDDGSVNPVASFGAGTEYLNSIQISTRADLPQGNGPTGISVREGRPVICQDFMADPMTAAFRKQAEPYGWGASATLPIMRGKHAYAAMALYQTRVNAFTHEIIDLISEMVINIGHGLDLFDMESEKLQAEESMKLAATIYGSSAEAVMVTDENNKIIDVNPAFVSQTGYSLDEVRGKNPSVLQSGRHEKAFYQKMWHDILEKGNWQGELWDRRKDGSLHAKFINISLIRHEDGSVYRHVAQFFDITDRKQKEELIWKQAYFDALTDLPNRRLFQDRLDQQIKKSHRTGTSLALLFIDLDRFKAINDTLGHAKGDQLLEEAANRIVGCVRETDTVARLGGDEFTVILPEFGGHLHLERVAQNIIRELARPFDLGDGDVGYISASIGIALYPDDADNYSNLMQHADQAMYLAKSEGRNRFNYFISSMQQEAQEKLALTNDLRQALVRGELEVYYQPIVEMLSGRITKAEALLRWHHPQRGMIAPSVFIPLAEESGLIIDIGDWVFQETVVAIAQWLKRFGSIIPISVNRSPLQFERSELNWGSFLSGMGLPGNSITVEITEGMLLKQSEKVRQCLIDYRNDGIEVSIDDFGTGFSALSYLKRFDIDYLKIDRSFISDLTQDENDRALTQAIIVMAQSLGIKVIAEGVEVAEQRNLLMDFGCDFAQGFLYSRPVPKQEFEELLSHNVKKPVVQE